MIKKPLHCTGECDVNNIYTALCGLNIKGGTEDHDEYEHFLEFINNRRKLYSDNYLCNGCVEIVANFIFK